jgi:hypothetical protein
MSLRTFFCGRLMMTRDLEKAQRYLERALAQVDERALYAAADHIRSSQAYIRRAKLALKAYRIHRLRALERAEMDQHP